MLGCRRIYLPRLGGVFCALGMQYSDLRHDYVRSFAQLLTSENLEKLGDLFDEMSDKTRTILVNQGLGERDLTYLRELDLCYRGQEWQVRIGFPEDLSSDVTALRARFKSLMALI